MSANIDRKSEERALRTASMYLTPRFHRLDTLQRFAHGTQYDGRRNFYDAAVPLRERAPSIVYPVVGRAIDSHINMVLGEGRWPQIGSFVSEDDSGDDFGLSTNDSQTLDSTIAKMVEQTRLKSAMRDALHHALEQTSVAVHVGVTNGQLRVCCLEAKKCTPEFASDGSVARLTIEYPYIDQFRDVDGRWKSRVMLYKRVIDDVADVTFRPALADERGVEPEWVPETVINHGLGFCPVVWYPFLGTYGDGFDGHSIYEELTDEIECLDMGLSQRDRAAFYSGDPQLYETGVKAGEGPAAKGRTSDVDKDAAAGWVVERSGGRPARKKGAGVVWRYDSPEAKVGMLTLPGDALKALTDHCADLQSKLERSLHFVDPDATSAKALTDLSAKAIELLYRPQLNFADAVREDFGDHCLLATVSMLLRVVLRFASGLYLGGATKAATVLRQFERQAADGSLVWMPPRLDLRWGPYFALTSGDEQSVLTTCKSAIDAGFVTLELALEKIKQAGIFGIGSITDLVDALNAKDEEPESQSEVVPAAQVEDTSKPVQVPLAPTDMAAVVRVNEVRAGIGLGTMPHGELTVVQFKALNADAIATAAAADAGDALPASDKGPESQPDSEQPSKPAPFAKVETEEDAGIDGPVSQRGRAS